MSVPRAVHTSTRIAEGSVLVAGRFTDNKPTIADAEVFDPTASVFRPLPPMTSPRAPQIAPTAQTWLYR